MTNCVLLARPNEIIKIVVLGELCVCVSVCACVCCPCICKKGSVSDLFMVRLCIIQASLYH